METTFNCKIDSHVPTEDGMDCECKYFKKNGGYFANYLEKLEEGLKKEMKEDLTNILDFVERYNKKDEEIGIAESAAKLSEWINSNKSIHSIN